MLSDVHNRSDYHSQWVDGVVDGIDRLWDHETTIILVGDGTTFRESTELAETGIQPLHEGHAFPLSTIFMQFKNTLDVQIGGEKHNQLFHGVE
jgi:hypothetical protein